MKVYVKYILCLISAVLTALAFAMPSFGALAWLSVTPFAFVLFYNVKNAKESAKCSFLFGLSFYLVLITWIFRLYPLENLNINPLLCVVILFAAWILISLIMAAEFALFGFLFKKFNFSELLYPLSFASLWILMEFLQQFGEMGFTWGKIALTQYKYVPIIRSASLFGSLFISFTIIFVNASLAVGIKNIRERERGYMAFLMAVLCFSLNVVLSFAAPVLKPYKSINAALVWEDIDPTLKGGGNLTENTFEFFIRESKKQDADLVLWTETAVPVVFDEVEEYVKEYKKMCREKGFMLMAGGFEREGEKLYSSVLAISPEGEILGNINKRHIVPFGEYIPFRNVIKIFVPQISKFSPEEEEISSYSGECVIETELGKIGGIICFDSTFPKLSRQTVMAGAEILTLSTNDAWFYGSHAAENHLSQSVFRAVENGRYILRSANLGESCIIDDRGNIIKREERGKKSLSSDAALIKEKTLYTRVGDVFVFAAVTVTIFLKKKISQKQ